MREASLRVIITGMLLRGGPVLVRRLRYAGAVIAVLVALFAGVVDFNQSADASSYDSEELQFLQLINDYRGNNGLGALLLSDALAVAAEHHSQDMARYSFFAHNSVVSSYYPAGYEPWDRMADEGYDYNTYKGENIAVGYETAEEAFEAWRNSPSHNHAMLDGSYRVIGIARINEPGSVHGWYWTTDFGQVLDPTSHEPGKESPQALDNEDEPAPQPQKGREDREEPVVDGPGVENGEMDSKAVWEQEARDGAALILDEYARLGNYDSGRDDLRQTIEVGKSTGLSYSVRVETDEQRQPSDLLTVRLTNREGEQLAVLERYTHADAGGWRRETLDLSRFAGQTVYLSFFVETDSALRTAFYLDRVTLENGESP